METFSTLLALCAGNLPVTGEFPTQRPVTRSFDVFFICSWINGWVNNREAGDLRRHLAHYDVSVMPTPYSRITSTGVRAKCDLRFNVCCRCTVSTNVFNWIAVYQKPIIFIAGRSHERHDVSYLRELYCIISVSWYRYIMCVNTCGSLVIIWVRSNSRFF